MARSPSPLRALWPKVWRTPNSMPSEFGEVMTPICWEFRALGTQTTAEFREQGTRTGGANR
eukprot:5518135-Alexandrium_andersonii.AAC.1